MQKIRITERRTRSKGGTAVISFRVKRSTKRKLERLPESERRVIFEALSESLEEIERAKEAARTIDRLMEIMKKRVKPSKKGFAEQSVKEDRYENH